MEFQPAAVAGGTFAGDVAGLALLLTGIPLLVHGLEHFLLLGGVPWEIADDLDDTIVWVALTQLRRVPGKEAA